MTYKIFQVSRAEKTVYNVFILKFKTTEEMIRHCFEQDDELFFYYGASTR